MGRTKLYDRDSVLDAAMLMFWQRGFANTSLQELERVTGVNKSGLYAEFDGKDDLYLSSLRHYIARRAGEGLLTRLPLGWTNVASLLRRGPVSAPGRSGCFAIDALRECAALPAAEPIVAASRAAMVTMLAQNIAAEGTSTPAVELADIVWVFFMGLCVEMHTSPAPRARARKIDHFLAMLKTM